MARGSAASPATAMTGPTAPAIVDAALRIKATSFLIDGEAVIARDDGTADFHALRGRRRGHEAVLYAFDLIEHDGDDLRDLPLIKRKRRLARLLGKAKRRAIKFVLTGDGDRVRACLPHGLRGHRVEADGCALSRRRTRRARRCAGSARRSGTPDDQVTPIARHP